MQDNYTCIGIWANQHTVEKPTSLQGAVAVIMRPNTQVGLMPEHVFTGLKFRSRYLRRFKRTTLEGKSRAKMLRQIYQQTINDPARVEAIAARNAKEIAAGIERVPYEQQLQEIEAEEAAQRAKRPLKLPEECATVVVTDECKLCILHVDGRVITIAPDRELYL